MSEKITITEIAERANTSKTTVSFYLNGKMDKMSEDTKKRIERVIAETNYHPSMAARSLNAKHTRLIGVIIGNITNTFANQIVKGIDDFARGDHYQLIVGNSNYDFEIEENYVNRMLSMGVDGFIIQPSRRFSSLTKLIKEKGKEVVFIDSQVSMDDEKWVKTNNYEAVLALISEYGDKQYDEFMMITADPSVLSTRMERVKGFEDALTLKGLTWKTKIVDGDIQVEELQKLIESELRFGTKTLIFVANCFLLPRVFLAMRNYRNLMPETIGLIGFDNTEWTNLSAPSVTTIVQPAYEEGYQSAKILIDAIEKKWKECPNQILSCEIHWHESTL
ncbi:LacI family DNA-binding transcriptional regulator [Bulleidia sp. zg-1006]|uniref:LacI family DNA-binding transcriptional regulator n=1 Tax=Bulleidia sp. zg-1006 TaxID=2806552 RepID=UPI001939DF55|nr:LacI family DNA-binding transcriptional regulator [Bulleidia sp. zg-1006]QRG86127.1 LacI family DNA-binding transcriptional regulator [Bulleidia sp. zg-1006]